MTTHSRAVRCLALLAPIALLSPPIAAQQAVPDVPCSYAEEGCTREAAPKFLTAEGETPWLYENSDIPRDEAWLFGEMDNGLRYAVRRNGVPPDQVSIRVRIDAGSLHEEDSELGYAHLLEHLLFRESKYLGVSEAIPTWQRLGATFGSDTNAETSPTHTVYKLDLPNIDGAKLDESMKLLSGMVRAPVLSDANVSTEVPIVLAEKRERGGAAYRSAEETRRTLFAGQRLAQRPPIGTEETLTGATGKSVSAFYKRWYRPENTVIVAVGDMDPAVLAAQIEKWFGDWKGEGAPVPAPDFGDPVAPEGTDPANPVGELAIIVEPDLPRSLAYGFMRPWEQVDDTIAYNVGRMRKDVATALINRRLEARARAGGSYLSAAVGRQKISRSIDTTLVSVVPLSEDWETALADVRAVIADALARPASEEEIARELSQMEIGYISYLEQATVEATSAHADTLVGAVDIRETVANPQTFLDVFREMKAVATPELVFEDTKALFEGAVIRGSYTTPVAGEADRAQLRTALLAPVEADGTARLAAKTISFDELPPIGEPGEIVQQAPLGVLDIERVDFANGVKVLMWANDAEPGRVSVKVRFGGGYRAIDPADAAYVDLGRMALVGSGIGELGQEELDRISTGRRMSFEFDVGEGAFTFFAQTRGADLADQLYLLAGKLAMPRWDANPVIRAQAASRLAYETYGSTPGGVLNRDLEQLLRGGDARYATADPQAIAATTPEGFRAFWEPILMQGPVEVLLFGDFDRAEGIEALRRTFGALAPRTPLAAEVAARVPGTPVLGDTQILQHRGDANQAAAVIAWPSGAGVPGLRESRQLEILIQVFNNRLLDAMREEAGASYAPVVRSDWPSDVASGGRIYGIAQLTPDDVPIFFRAADKIAADLIQAPPSADELARVTEPLTQYIRRASTGNLFWMFNLEGSTVEPQRVALLRSLLTDYSRTTPENMQALARKYFGGEAGYRLAVVPEGQGLSTRVIPSPAPAIMEGR